MVSTKTKKPVKKVETEEVVTNITVADCTEFASIAFDKNNNVYGIDKQGSLFFYVWDSKEWVAK